MGRMDQAAKRREERRLKAETETETTDDFGVGRVAGRKRMQNRANGTTTGGSATTTPATKAKKYNVGVSKGGVPFAEAFDYYRNEKKQKTFTWNGKKYTTDLKDGGKPGTGNTGTGTTGTGKTGNGKTSTEETSASKKSAARKAVDRLRRRRTRVGGRAGGGMMAKKFNQGGSAEEEPSEKSIGAKRHAKRVEAQMAEIERIRKNNKKKVPRKKRPTDKSLKARQAKEKARLAEITISKDRVGSSRGGRVPKEEMEERFFQGLKSRNKKRSMNRGGMMKKKGYAKGGMTKKGYAKGGMTKKGYAKGGSVRGKPRGVGAALRGYGKALT